MSVFQQNGGPRKEVFNPVLTRGVGLPYQFNYQSSHLASSGVIPVKKVPDSSSGSDMDISLDSDDDDLYGGKYSVKSSKDDKAVNGAAPIYSSDSYSSSSASLSNSESNANAKKVFFLNLPIIYRNELFCY